MKNVSIFLKMCSIVLGITFLPLDARSFMISCWVPYWRCAVAIETVKDHAPLFNQVSPFSYEVNPDGSLKDQFKKNKALWDSLKSLCKEQNIIIVPTIFWTKTQEMHAIFSDPVKLKQHTQAILDLVTTEHLDGININYERIHSNDRTSYCNFLEDLSKKLHRQKKVLHISIGGRTSDSTIGIIEHAKTPLKSTNLSSLKRRMLSSVSLSPGSGKEAQRYKKIIAQCCDQVHIMGYDEWGTPYTSSKEHLTNEYYVSHASNQWIEQIIKYALSYIPRHKIVLGVPTYGLEFSIMNKGGSISFKKKRNVSYTVVSELLAALQKKPQRTAGGEFSFTYTQGDEKRYVCYLNAQAIKEKIRLVKKYRIKGINIFTVNGNEDQKIWELLEDELWWSSLV